MKDIAIIIPIHNLKNKAERDMLNKALDNVKECQSNYEFNLNTYIVAPEDVITKEKLSTKCVNIIKNEGKTDFCSQINLAANSVSEDYFSILEFDDEYNKKWFSMANEYYYTNEDVSVFLPINIQMFSKEEYRQFANETPWAMEFSEELGYIDFKCLANYYGFNLTGGIFNRKDFISVGGLKPSIEVAFNYEFLLRLTNKNLKVFVVPKEGYRHLVDRDNSLTDICGGKFTQEEVDKWYSIAHKEYAYDEDRNVTIYTKEEDNKQD